MKKFYYVCKFVLIIFFLKLTVIMFQTVASLTLTWIQDVLYIFFMKHFRNYTVFKILYKILKM